MPQSRKSSLVEAIINSIIGYTVAILAQLAIFPLFGIIVPLHTNLAIGGLFTLVAVARTYAIRRLFNWWHGRSRHTVFDTIPSKRAEPEQTAALGAKDQAEKRPA